MEKSMFRGLKSEKSIFKVQNVEKSMFQGSKISAAALYRPARRLPRAAAEANRAVDMLRTGGDLDAVMQLGSAGGRGARGGAKRI